MNADKHRYLCLNKEKAWSLLALAVDFRKTGFIPFALNLSKSAGGTIIVLLTKGTTVSP
jgi:hypothetical protein